MDALARARRLARLVHAYGPAETVRLLRLRRYEALRRAAAQPGAALRVLPAYLPHPLWVRRQTTDVQVYQQVLFHREYGCLDDLTDVGLILDCGANVGYTSAYFLNQFPDARVIAVEPDADNFAALARNVAPYGRRVRCLQAGVWSHDAGLVVEGAGHTGSEWGRQVRACRDGEAPHVQGVSVPALLALDGAERISILKVDIEGAEAVVFGPGAATWLGRVDAIAIELHDWTPFGDASRVFFDAIADQGFRLSTSGELTVCRRDGVPTRTVDA